MWFDEPGIIQKAHCHGMAEKNRGRIMNKSKVWNVVSLFLLISGVRCLGAFYKTQTLQEKTSHEDLTFAVTFDNRGTKAERAAGSPVSSLPGLDMGLRGVVGFDNQQGFEPIGDEELFYKAERNISPREGPVSLWIAAGNYSPAEELTNGKSRGNIALFEAVFRQNDDHLLFRLYEFKDCVYFDIWAKGFQYPSQPLAASRKSLRQKQWHLIAITWTPEKYCIYLNGEMVHSLPIGRELGGKMKAEWDLSQSHFGIPLTVWGERRAFSVQFDDMKVYGRALNNTEILRMFAEIDTQADRRDLALLNLALHGVDRTVDTLDLEIDMFSLPAKYASQLQKGVLTLQYSLTGPHGFNKTGKITARKKRETLQLKGIDKPGEYTVSVSIEDGSELVPAGNVSIQRPDLSFMGNKIGIADNVPEPFTPLNVEDGIVKLWNREYHFGNSPFPERILLNGSDLLIKPPCLVVELEKGRHETIAFMEKSRRHNRREAVFEGEGGFGPERRYTVKYRSVVAYDGMIRIDWSIHGRPTISGMRLEYQQNTKFTQRLMTPLLQDKAPFSFPYSKKTWGIPHIIWMVTEKLGGMAYTVENDANWIYKDKEEVFSVDRSTGKVSVTMISSQVQLPEETPYHALFTVTPTRPCHPLSHLIRLANSEQYTDCGKKLSSDPQHQGLSYNFDAKWYADKFEENDEDGSRLLYGMADSVSTLDKVGCFFARDYEVPGAFAYTFDEPKYDPETKKVSKTKSNSLSACSATSAPDYLLYNQHRLINSRYRHKFWGIYYDLCGNDPCSNPHHGCSFLDKFGREVATRPLLHKRRLFERTLVMLRDQGKILFLHSQREFNPFMHGFGDYWYPGEENNGLMQNNLNCYCDDIQDSNWQSEYNTDLLGVNVVFLGASDAWRKEIAEQLVGQCLLHNIEFGTAWMPGDVIYKVWNLCERYGTDTAAFFRYDRQRDVISSSHDLKISYYKPQGGKSILFILMNRKPFNIASEIDFSSLGILNASAKDVYGEKDYQIANGKLHLDVRPYSFMMLAVPPLGFYPYKDNGSLPIGRWKPNESALAFHNSPRGLKAGRTYTLIATAGADNSGCFTLNPNAVPGRTYTFRLKIRGEGLNPEAQAHILVLAQSAQKSIGLVPGAELKAVPEDDWRECIVSGRIPTGQIWDETVKVQFTMSSLNLKQGRMFFKDIVIEEE